MNELDLLKEWMPEVPPSDDVRDHARTSLQARLTAGAPSMAARPISRRLRGRVAIAGAVATALVVGGVVWSQHEVDRRVSEVKTVALPKGDLAGGELGNGPVNILVIGSDSRALVSNDAAFGKPGETPGARSDTMILVHIDGDTANALWIPRDLSASADLSDTAKLNASFEAGPSALIAAVRSRLGVSVDHYVEIGFRSFQKVVDIIGGVRIATPGHVRDSFTGLDLPGPGCQSLDGTQALQWVRSRHLQTLVNGVWTDTSPRADLDRVVRQQAFIRAMENGVRARVGGDLRTGIELVDAVIPELIVDSEFSRSEILRLVRVLLGVNRDGLTSATLPVVESNRSDSVFLDPQQPEADAALAPFRGESRPAHSTPTTPSTPAPAPDC